MAKPATAVAGSGKKAADGSDAQPKKSKKKLLMILVPVVLVLAVAGYFVGLPMLVGKHPAHAHAVALPPGPVVDLPQITTNLADGHIIQIGLAMQLSSKSLPTGIPAVQPRLVNTVLATLGTFTYPQLLAPAGRLQAQQLLEAKMAPLVASAKGSPQLQTVYFTSFVIQ
ncbi:MAG: flagellar basal body-associated FliL family protein [Actinomycetota bacterium]|nr:flagellar basal body-associated FliL family protein [Actinomycetota bacterium]